MKNFPSRSYLGLLLVLLGLTAYWQRAAIVPSRPASLATPVAAAAAPAEIVAPPLQIAPRPSVLPGAAPAPGITEATPFTRFDEWANRYFAARASDRAALIAEGRALAAERRVVLAKLIQTDPRTALQNAVPMVARQQLPAEIVAQLEDRVAGRGDLALLGTTPTPGQPVQDATFRIAAIDDVTYRAHVFGRRDLPATVAKTSINGVALDGHLAVAESPLRVLEAGEVAGNRPLDAVCEVSGTSSPASADTPLNTAASVATAVEYDGAVHMLCGANHLAKTEGRLLAREESNVAAAGGSTGVDVAGRPSVAWTHGPKKLLVIRVDFSDRAGGPTNVDGSITSDADVVAVTAPIQDFYANASFGKTSLVLSPAVNGDSPDVSPILRMPQTATYYESTGSGDRSWQLHVDARAAAQAAGIDVASYDRVGVVFANMNFWWSGLGEIGGRNFWINAPYTFHVVTHELGHTYGMMHSNSWWVTDGNPISPNGNSVEYGDEHDIMGGGSDPSKQFSHWNKSMLQWIPDSAVTSATTSGTYRIYRFDHAAANLDLPRALKIRRNDQQDYWIGYRRGTVNPSMQNGAYILWGYHDNRQGNLIDMRPDTANNFYDAALPVGSTFSDMSAAVTIKTLAQGGSGAEEWLDIQVNMLPNVRWAQTGEWNVGEQDGQAVLRVSRQGDSAGAVSVNYTTADGLATAPADYAAQSGTLTWASGDTADKFISIPIQSDTIWEAGERFTVTLSTPTGAVIAGNAAATVAILDTGIRDFGWTQDFIPGRVEKVITMPDGGLLVGGSFQGVQDSGLAMQPRQGLAKFSDDGRLVPDFAGGVTGADAVVHALARQPAGGVIVGGSFTDVQGASHANIARLRADGVVDGTFTATTNGVVWTAVAQPDGRVLIGGSFTSVNGVPREYLARLNADGTLDTTFVGPDFDGGSGLFVKSIAIQPDGRILVGGLFVIFDQVYLRSSLCRVTANGALDSTFAVRQGAHQAGNPNQLGEVRAIVVQPDARILIGGTFSAYNGVARGGLARLNADGSVDTGFTPSTDGRCNTLMSLPDGRLIAGGWFSNANGAAAKNIALFNANGALDANMASAGGFAGEIHDFQLAANARLQFCGDAGSFEYSSEARPVWRMISGITNLPGTVQLAAASAQGTEGGNVTVSVTRTGGSGGAIAVGYATAPGTAAATDFQRTTGVLTWADGDASPKTITIALTSDAAAESAETFTVGLGAPVLGGASLGGLLQSTITINDGGAPSTGGGGGSWEAGDIGSVGAAGSASESGGVVTINGAGADIWGTSDAFHFRAQTLTGDGAIIVRVASLGNAHPWAKVGIMFREDLTPGSREVMAFITPGNHSGIQYRLTPNGDSASGADVWSGIPVWLMLARAGDTFGAYRSYNGNDWTQIGTINCDLPDTALVGLAVSSHTAGVTMNATFDNVEVIGVEAPPAGTPPAAPSWLATSGATASTVHLAWTDNSNNETGFAIERAPGSSTTFVEVGSVGANVAVFDDSGLTANTAYTYRVRARRDSVYSDYSNTSLITTTSTPPASGWQGVDIGNVGSAGSETITDPNITVRAGGDDIWFAVDGFRFVYQAWHGDGEIKARVASLTNTHPWAKAGVMFRESLAAGSRNVAYLLTADNASGLQVRSAAGGDTTMTNGPWVRAPYWVKLVRSGNLFTSFISPDGVTWTAQGMVTVAMGTDIYVGVAASAHTTTATTTAAFEYVTLPASTTTPPTTTPATWTSATLGAGSGSFTEPEANAVTLNATGEDIWGQFDQGFLVQRALSGDGEIVARLESLTNTHPWAKAGLMLRENLQATSPNAFVALTPTNGATFQVRGASSGVTAEAQHSWQPGAPCWLKLTRAGNTITAAFSTNGTTWTSLGSQALTMATDIYVGLAVSSHAASPASAVFRNITVSTSVSNPPPSEPPVTPPPSTWTQTSLGTATGSFTSSDATHVSVTSTGSDLWNQSDDGLFVQRAWTGDGVITARLDSMSNTHPWAKAGLMFRENLAAGSANVFVGLTPTNGAAFQVRAATGVATTEPQHNWQPGAPCWLRLTRAGNLFTAAFSTNGTTWTTLGSQTVAMSSAIYVGFATSSHATASGTAAFSSVQVQ